MFSSSVRFSMIEDYLILGVRFGASSEEIRSAYRKRARECHPDKGGSQEEFQRLQSAYERLTEQRDLRERLVQCFQKLWSVCRDASSEAANAAANAGTSGVRSCSRVSLRVSLEDLYCFRTKVFEYEFGGERRKLALRLDNLEVLDSPLLISAGGGDLEVTFFVEDHSVFMYNPALSLYDLWVIRRVSFHEFYYGLSLSLVLLSGELWQEQVVPYSQGDKTYCISGAGMPKNPGRTEWGDLFVRFEVDLYQVDSAYLQTEACHRALGALCRGSGSSEGRQ